MRIAKADESERPREALRDEPYVRFDQLVGSFDDSIEKAEISYILGSLKKLGLIAQMYLEAFNQYWTKEYWLSNCFDNFDESKDENRENCVHEHRPSDYEGIAHYV